MTRYRLTIEAEDDGDDGEFLKSVFADLVVKAATDTQMVKAEIVEMLDPKPVAEDRT